MSLASITTEVPPSKIMLEFTKAVAIEDVSSLLSDFVNQQPQLVEYYRMGKLYKSSALSSKSSNDVLLILVEAIKELFERELKYNNDIEKTKLLKNNIQIINTTISMLKELKIDCSRDKLLFMMLGLLI